MRTRQVRGLKHISAVAAVALTLGIAGAPAFAEGGHGEGHHKGNDANSSHSEHGHKPKTATFPLLLTTLSQDQQKDDPLVKSEDTKLLSDIQAAVQLQTSLQSSTTASGNTTATLATEQQMQAILTQMMTVTSMNQLITLLHQLGSLTENLKQAVHTPVPFNQLAKTIKRAQQDEQSVINRYNSVNEKVSAYLSTYSQGTALKRSTINEGLRLLRAYQGTSNWTLAVFSKVDDRLTHVEQENEGDVSGSGSGSAVVDPAHSSTALSATTVSAGQNVTITGAVGNVAGQVLANVPVVVSVDGKSAQVNTSPTGQFSVTLAPTVAVTNAPVTVVANGVQLSTSATVLSVTPATAAALLSSVTANTYVNANVANQVTYTVKDAYGNPVVGDTLNLAIQQVVGPTAETTNEASEAVGSLSTASAVTNAQGQVAVTYTASSTADTDGDLQDHVIASVPSTTLINSQAQFTY